MIICIDPGHGLSNRVRGLFDPGNTASGMREADIVLRYGFALAEACARRGWDFTMTRSSNLRDMPLTDRVPFAKARGCDLLVSLHTNAAANPDGTINPKPRGVEVHYHDQLALAAGVAYNISTKLGIPNRGPKNSPGFAVLRGGVPAVLVEIGFQTNPDEALLLALPESFQVVSDSICDAIASTVLTV